MPQPFVPAPPEASHSVTQSWGPPFAPGAEDVDVEHPVAARTETRSAASAYEAEVFFIMTAALDCHDLFFSTSFEELGFRVVPSARRQRA